MARLNHKKGRKSNYVKSLGNTNHREVKRKALIRDKFQCREEGCNSKIYLELHHITYYVDNLPIIGKELEYLEWVVILCERCHQKVHSDVNHKWNPNNIRKQPIC